MPQGQASRAPSAPSSIPSLGFYRFMRENAKLEAAGKPPAGAKRILLGITKASLSTDSFISAASRLPPADGMPRWRSEPVYLRQAHTRLKTFVISFQASRSTGTDFVGAQRPVLSDRRSVGPRPGCALPLRGGFALARLRARPNRFDGRRPPVSGRGLSCAYAAFGDRSSN